MPTRAVNLPFVLVIRDGWGQNPNPEHDAFNAIKIAKTPVADRIEREWPTTLVATSGVDVGLVAGTMGNSEVGHQNIGAGRIVDQDSVRISRVCREGKLPEVSAIRDAITGARDSTAAVHLIGICSDAGVHGLLEHLDVLIDLCGQLGAPRVFVHLFTDGRDTGPFTGAAYTQQVEAKCAGTSFARVASVVGRYWAMDRDNRWERVRRAYDLLTGRGETPPNFETTGAAIADFYEHPESDAMKGDEFISPRSIGDAAISRIADGDAVVFFNYRGDRPRELCSAFLLPAFDGADEVPPSPESGHRGFDRGPRLDLRFVLMTPYSERLASLAQVAFKKPPKMKNIAGEYLGRMGITQLRCAETEKFPHVTYFFNDYRDPPFEGEYREIIQSPRVATYDQQPEMSAEGICRAVLDRLNESHGGGFIVVNFANGDMVGHTGSLDAAVRACEVVDACTGRIIDAVLAKGGSMIVTADHGNAEQMWSPTDNSPHTAHTIYDVPLSTIGEPFRGRSLRAGGRLADIMPTALVMLGMPRPEEMTGRSLLE